MMIRRAISHARRANIIPKVNKKARRLRWEYWDVPRCSLDLGMPALAGPSVVFGSAPTAVVPEGYRDDWNLITANAAQAVAETLGCKRPDMTVITAQILRDRPEYEGSKRAITGKTTGHLVLIERGITCQQAEQVLQGLEYSYSEFTVLSNTHRAKFTKKVFGRNLYMGTGGDKLSTGLFAACLAIFLGSDPIIVSGFSLSVSGHGYSDTVHLKRSHLESDRFALDYMSRKNLPVFAADEGFAGDSGLKLWKG